MAQRTWLWVEEFSWGDEFNRYEVSIERDHLEWSWLGPKDLGGAASQTFDEYWRKGPLDADAPAEVIARLESALERMSSPPHTVTPLATAADPPSHAPTVPPALSASAPRAFVEALDAPPLPLWRTIGLGSAVFVLGIVPATLLVPYAPLLAGFVGLFLPVLIGFFIGFRWGGSAVVVAGFFALAGAIAMVMQYQRALAAAAGPFVELASVDAIVSHQEATRFSFGDARLVHEALGSATSQTLSGKRTSTWRHLAAPLVSHAASQGAPVAAWLVCTTTPGFDCLSSVTNPVRGAVRSDDAQRANYLAAVHAAEREHGLSSAPGAALLEINGDPEEAPVRRYVLGLMAALGTWLAWLLGLALSHVWGMVRARTKTS